MSCISGGHLRQVFAGKCRFLQAKAGFCQHMYHHKELVPKITSLPTTTYHPVILSESQVATTDAQGYFQPSLFFESLFSHRKKCSK